MTDLSRAIVEATPVGRRAGHPPEPRKMTVEKADQEIRVLIGTELSKVQSNTLTEILEQLSEDAWQEGIQQAQEG